MLGGGGAVLRPNIDPTKSGGAIGGATQNVSATAGGIVSMKCAAITMEASYRLGRDFQLSLSADGRFEHLSSSRAGRTEVLL